jgi:hypothetical protein
MRTSPRLNRFTRVALGFALVCLCAILSAQDRPENPAPTNFSGAFKIAGVVVSEASGAPLARTRVTIVDTKNSRNMLWMITGDDGRFEFNNLGAGKYSLQGARRGFIPTAYNEHEQFSTAIVTGATLETENLILRLVPTATISGKVVDEVGEPIHNAQVRLYRENRNLGVSRVTQFSNSSSDDRGFYDFWPVIPGTYYVSARARPWYAVHPPASRPEGAGNGVQATGGGGFIVNAVDASLDVAYPSTFYADTTEADAATPVAIKGGDHAQIDIHLSPVPSLHLLFHVAENGQNGFPMATLQKRVFDSVENAGTDGMQPVSADTYELTGVPAGTYTVRLRSRTPGEGDQSVEMNLTKDGQELDNARGEPLGSLTLSVKILGEEKLPQQLMVTLRDAHLRTVGIRPVDRNGEVHFDGLPAGKYAIVAFGQGKPYFVSQTGVSGSETSGNSFDITPGSSLTMSAMLIGGATRVEGFVKRSGKAAAGVMVVLVPANPESYIELFRRDQSDFDGSFVLPGVVPGSYTVIAIEDGWSVDWSRPAVLARYTPRGQKLTIGPQIQKSVSLPEPVEVQPK